MGEAVFFIFKFMSQYSNNDYNINLKPLGRALRKSMTPGEKKLWYEVLNKSKMRGHRFLRQRPIDKYIVDFFCKELKLIIEVDGRYHDSQMEKDMERDRKLAILGYETLRISHAFIMNDIFNAIRTIEAKVIEREELLPDKTSPL